MTRCSQCGFDNPPGMRFCGGCGSRLGVDSNALKTEMERDAASAQGTAPGASASAADALGVMIGADLKDRLKRAGVEAAGQRRNVTILFTDLSGYTSLSERMDSEDVFDLIQQYIQVLIKNVYKYEGIVDKLTGDGLMALFGAPIAHENNAERAVRAALDMQADVRELSKKMREELGVELSMRVGLHSGIVIVGGVGSDSLMDYTAIGDTVNLARRIEEAAPNGSTLVSESVYRQTRSLFLYQQVSVLNPKGIGHPVVAFGVLGARSKPGQVRGVEGLRAPMIGRDQELEWLKQAVSDLVSNKRGQLVLITGEAGLGKSRLTVEFKAALGQRSLRIMEGQSLAYRRSISYWIFMDVIYSCLGLNANAPPHLVQDRLIKHAYKLMGSQAGQVIPYLEHMLSLPYSDPATAERLRYLDAGQLRQQIFLAVRDLLMVESYIQPLLLILEDLHWADDASLELLQFLVQSLRQAPIFVLLISRSVMEGPLKKIADWGKTHLRERFRIIQLQNLSFDQSEQLLFQLLSIPALPAEIREQILKRAAGIPFYLEEILRTLIDAGAIRKENGHWKLIPGIDVDTPGVPETLQGLILARFDRLEAVERHVLQVASVIGINFSLQLLCAVVESSSEEEVQKAVETLVEREFILPKGDQSKAEYAFRHILMSDAIYGTLLRRERRKIHGLVGETIERLYADRLESQIELLANHFRWSNRMDRALHYLILAGQKSARNNTHEQARQHFQAALEMLPEVEHTDDQTFQVNAGVGDELVFFGDYPAARQHYQEALNAISTESGKEHWEERCALYRKIAKTHERQGEYDQALVYLAEAEGALSAAPTSAPVERAQTLNDIGWIDFRRGNFLEAQQVLQEALDLVEASDAYDAIASIYNRLGGVAYNQGGWDLAAGYLRKSIAIRESIGDVVGLATSFNNLGLLEIEMGQFDNALANLTRSYELKKRLGQSEGIAMTLNNLGWLRIDRGELLEAEKALKEALDLAQQIGYASLLRLISKNLGKVYLAAQEWEKAQEALGGTTSALMELGAHDQLIDTYRLLGEAALGAGDQESAQAWAQKAIELADASGNETEELSAVQRGELWMFLGMLATRQKEFEIANSYLSKSNSVFQQLKSRLYQGRVAYQMGMLAEAQNDRRTAQLRFREAALFFQSVGAKLDEKRAEEARMRQSL